MGFGQRGADRQTQAHPAVLLVDLLVALFKRLEQPCQHVWRNPHAAVGNLHLELSVRRIGGAHGDAAGFRG